MYDCRKTNVRSGEIHFYTRLVAKGPQIRVTRLPSGEGYSVGERSDRHGP